MDINAAVIPLGPFHPKKTRMLPLTYLAKHVALGDLPMPNLFIAYVPR